MTEGHQRTPECLNASALAAFVDGSMGPADRARAEAHLADCEDCYEAFVEVVRLSGELAPAVQAGPAVPAPVVGRRRRASVLYAGAAIAAGLVVATWIGVRWASPDAQLQRALAILGQEAGAHRPSVARMTLSSRWAPPAVITRSGAPTDLSVRAREAALAIERLAGNEGSAAHIDALGMAALASGDVNRSIEILRRGAALAPESTSIRTNLSAALFQRWTIDNTAEDLSAALDASEIALQAAPRLAPAAFNKALALEALGLKPQAIEAWRAFLALESDSAWQREAQSHLDALTKSAQMLTEQTEGVRTGSQATLNQLAGDRPTVLYNFLEDLLLEWLDKPETSLVRGVDAANALLAAKRDAALPALVLHAAESPTWDPERQAALITVIKGRAATLKAIDATHYGEAEASIRSAVQAQPNARIVGIELDMLLEQVRYYARRDVRAIEGLATLEPLARQAGYWRVLARSLQMRGVHSARESRFSDAASHYERGRHAADISGDQDVRGALLAVTGEILTQQGQFGEAWSFARLALVAIPEMRAYRSRHLAYSLAAVIAEQNGLPGTGLILSTGLLGVAAEFDNPAGVAAAQLRRARALALLNEPQQAAAAIDAAHAAAATIKDPSLKTGYLGDVSWNEAFVLRHTDPARAIRAIDVVFTTIDRTRNVARAAEALLVRGEANMTLGRLDDAERDWLRGIEVFEDQRPGIRENQLRVSRLNRVWGLFESLIALRRDRPVEALDILERSRARALLDSIGHTSTVTPLSGSALHSWLPSGVTAVAFSVHPERLLVFVIRDRGVTVHDHSIAAAELGDLVSRHVEAVRSHKNSAVSARLAALLIPAEVELRPDRPILFLPDGPLHNLPFGTLPVGPDGQVLVQRSEPVIAPSLSVAERLSHVLWTVPTTALVVAPDVEPSSGLPTLRGAKAEAEALRALYPALRQAAGPGLSSSSVLQLMSESPIIHFAGHAITDDRYPSRSRLVVDGGREQVGLTPADLAESRLTHGALAILAACDTARGTVIKGEGALTLARAFLAGGASSVVGTLWALDDAAASEFLVAVHRELVAGRRPATALARAQRTAIARGQHTVWPAFTIIGGFYKGA